jgi:uncharacterized protein
MPDNGLYSVCDSGDRPVDNCFKFMGCASAACLLFFGVANASVDTLKIRWSELRPGDGEVPATAGAAETSQGETLSWGLQGKTIELTGYLLPVDREGDLVYEFMLLPWGGLCAHVPPPPPNQTVHVISERPYKLSEIYEPVSISGVLKPGLETTQLFVLDGVTVIESGYSVGRAQVAKADDAAVPHKATPWNFLKK